MVSDHRVGAMSHNKVSQKRGGLAKRLPKKSMTQLSFSSEDKNVPSVRELVESIEPMRKARSGK